MAKRSITILLVLGMLVQLCCFSVSAGDTYYNDDPLYWEELHRDDSLYEDESVTFDDYTPRALKDGEVLRKGIDVSYYQNNLVDSRTLDWDAVKADGVEFVFVRVGYRGYGSAGKLQEDTYYKENIQGALDAGLIVGVYMFSQAITEEEAREEARFLMDRIGTYNVTLPLVMDYEYAGGSTGRLQAANLSKQAATDICHAFVDEAAQSGYQAMVYANKYFLYNQLHAGELDTVWLSHYISQTDYTGDYDFWQFTSQGAVDGITGRVDLNFWFDDGTLTTGLPFRDVALDTWYYQWICYAYEQGMITGVTSSAFKPGDVTTRSQVITMLYRLAGEPDVTEEATFTDLVRDYYKKPIAWGQAEGITNGTPGNLFDPEGKITRQDMVTMLYRMAGQPDPTGDISKFQDHASVSDYARNAMTWAVEQGLIKGVSETELILNPFGTATRAEAATLLARFHQMINSETE